MPDADRRSLAIGDGDSARPSEIEGEEASERVLPAIGGGDRSVEVAMRVVEPGGMLVVEIGQRALLQERGDAGTAAARAVLLLLRNDIPHRGPLLEDPSGRLARDGLFCAGGARCAGRAASIVNILAG